LLSIVRYSRKLQCLWRTDPPKLPLCMGKRWFPDYPFSAPSQPRVTDPTKPAPQPTPQPIPPRQLRNHHFKTGLICSHPVPSAPSIEYLPPYPLASPQSSSRLPEFKSRKNKTMATTMQAVVFKGPREVAVEQRPIPKILEATDAVVKVSLTALCGRYVM
jgi:hypothetical protein